LAESCHRRPGSRQLGRWRAPQPRAFPHGEPIATPGEVEGSGPGARAWYAGLVRGPGTRASGPHFCPGARAWYAGLWPAVLPGCAGLVRGPLARSSARVHGPGTRASGPQFCPGARAWYAGLWPAVLPGCAGLRPALSATPRKIVSVLVGAAARQPRLSQFGSGMRTGDVGWIPRGRVSPLRRPFGASAVGGAGVPRVARREAPPLHPWLQPTTPSGSIPPAPWDRQAPAWLRGRAWGYRGSDV
jgi:hypothetical protein